jgi:hypothetical protein
LPRPATLRPYGILILSSPTKWWEERCAPCRKSRMNILGKPSELQTVLVTEGFNCPGLYLFYFFHCI